VLIDFLNITTITDELLVARGRFWSHSSRTRQYQLEPDTCRLVTVSQLTNQKSAFSSDGCELELLPSATFACRAFMLTANEINGKVTSRLRLVRPK